LREQLPPECGQILEPMGRNTAPCLMLSVATLLRRGFDPQTAMVVLPADHYISRPESFRDAIGRAITAARANDAQVLLGVVPHTPHTGYGYIEAGSANGDARPVKRFVEKPTLERAEAFLADHSFFWNSGIFVWTLRTISQAFETHLGESWRALRAAADPAAIEQVYRQLPAVPVDVAILEKADRRLVIPVDMGWSDIGSWDALYQMRRTADGENVVLSGDLHAFDSRGCLVRADPKRKIALVGVQDLVLVEDGDTLLVAARQHDQKVRLAAESFEKPPTGG
jgi:mannose-1-phosphate guanylyltransferase